MAGERPKLERCISAVEDCAVALDTPQESEATPVDLASEMIADVERSLKNMTDVVHGIATNPQHPKMIELAVQMYDCLKLTLDRDLNRVFYVVNASARHATALKSSEHLSRV